MTKISRRGRSADIIYMTEVNANLWSKDKNFDHHDIHDVSHLPTGSPATNRRMCDVEEKRHRGSLNALYLDGHVISKLAKSFVKEDFMEKK